MAKNEQTIQESILQSIDYLINERVSNLALDQTITCTIIECTNSLTEEYKVQYQDGFFLAYSQNQTSYSKGELVYVLIPLGNFSNMKTITGRAYTITDKEVLSVLNLDKYKYKQTSGNCLLEGRCTFPQGLNSYKVQDGRYLYYKIEEHELSNFDLVEAIGRIPQMTFNEQEFKTGLAESKYIQLVANFRTNLLYSHKTSQRGKYGYAVTFAFKRNGAQPETKITNKGLEEFYKEEDIYYQTYTLDSDQMIGNPYRFQTESNQYIFYNINSEDLLYLKSVEIYSKDFEEVTVVGNDENDIFISNIQLYTADDATETDNEYKLIIFPLDGISFSKPKQTLRLKTTIFYQNNILSSENTINYNWFIKDDKINSNSLDYSYLAGARWRKLPWSSADITLKEESNTAYQNEYKLITTIVNNTQEDNSSQIVLSETIKIYNLTRKNLISLTCDRGIEYNFRNGIANITCLINGNDETESPFITDANNEDLSFWWSKTLISSTGEKTFTYLKSKEQLEQEYAEASAAETEAIRNNEDVNFSITQNLKREIQEYDNIVIHKNFFELNAANISENHVEIGCTVYQKVNQEDLYLGAAQITLTNGSEDVERGYSIEIVNGNQFFQYDEAGISPASEQSQSPQEVRPLSINFYSPEGTLIDPTTYDYFWIIPVVDTMFNYNIDSEDLKPYDEANNFKCFYEDILPLQIANTYNYSSINNQIKVQLTYEKEIFYEDTKFTFLKMGDNGTNGTKYSAKIISTEEPLNNSLLSILLTNLDNPCWNIDGYPPINQRQDMLKLEEYYNGELIKISNTDPVTWEILGGEWNSTFIQIDRDSGSVKYEYRVNKSELKQIIKATIENFEERTLYLNAFLGIPIINYRDSINYNISFNKNKTLQEILYNSDGLNPLYNTNLKFSFSWDYDGEETKYLSIESQTLQLKLLSDKGEYSGRAIIVPISKEDNSFECAIEPLEYFDGENYFGNGIRGYICNSVEEARRTTLEWNQGDFEVEFFVPIRVSFNTYGFKYLNAWDGNSIAINEEEGYILAPTIGAGEKDDQNLFTGIVMGKEILYHGDYEPEKRVGLLGYSKGRRSAFLDAETGRVELGVGPVKKIVKEVVENDGTSIEEESLRFVDIPTEGYQLGRIVFDPFGPSSIGKWIIGKNSLYNVTGKDKNAVVTLSHPNEDVTRVRNEDGTSQDISQKIGHIEDIAHEDSGILFSANPAYISIKGSHETVKNSIDQDDLEENEPLPESLELQLDPNSHSIFSIYGHYKINDEKWERRLKVGIDASGRFFANSLRDNYSSLNVNRIKAFGVKDKYIGLVNEVNLGETFDETNKVTVFKAFISGDQVNTTSPLFISGGNLENEYARPLHLYGKELKVYTQGVSTSDSRRHSTEAENSFAITDNNFELAHRKLQINEAGESSYAENTNTYPWKLKERRVIGGTIFRGFSINRDGDFNFYSDRNFNFYGKEFSFTNGDTLIFDRPLYLQINGQQIEFGNKNTTTSSSGRQEFIGDGGNSTMELGYSEDPHNGFWIDSTRDDDTVSFGLRHDELSGVEVGNGFYIDAGDGGLYLDSSQGFEISGGDNGQFNLDSDGFYLDPANGNSSTLIDGNGVRVVDGGIFADHASFTGDVEIGGNIQAGDFMFISNPILSSNKLGTELGQGLSLTQAKSIREQLNAIYRWSIIASGWNKDLQDFKEEVNNFKKQHAKDIQNINNNIAKIVQDLLKTMQTLGASDIDPQERYGTINEEVQTKHEVISSKEFYSKDFIRDADTVYFVIDDS